MNRSLDQEPEGSLAAAGAGALMPAATADAPTRAPENGATRAPENGAGGPSLTGGAVAAPGTPLDAHAPRSRTLLDIFTATALRCAERTAIDAADAVLSYAELADAAEQLAERLRELGVGPGDRVGVRVRSGSSELYLAILGVLTAGAAYVPVDADDPEERANELWARSGVCAIVRDGLSIEQLGTAHGAGGEPSLDDDAWVIFTSGSTGAPKGVAISHRAAAAFVDAEAQLFTVEREDRVLAGLSVGFDASCEEIWLAWRHGATLVPAPRELVRAGAELGPWIRRHGITVVSTVPTLAAMWDETSFEDVRLLILGGEASPESLAWRLAAQREVWNTYGPTEAAVVSTAARITAGAPVSIGWPLSGWKVAVLDQRGQPVALGEEGELVIGGVGLGRYLDDALDGERFAPVAALGWERAYRTGDIVRETVDGLQFVGRLDDQVKIGGRRIELGEIDAQLTAVHGVRAAMSAVRVTEAGNRLLVGYVVSDSEPSAIRKALAERLPDGLVPMIVTLESLPRGRSGKVDRKALPWPPPASAETANEQLEGTAAWVAERWVEQLGPQPLSAQSDFFELGGSSLSAAKLVSALRSRYPAIAVADLYENSRLGELAARLERLSAARAPAQVAPSPRYRAWAALQIAGVLLLKLVAAPQWLFGVLAVNKVLGGEIGPTIGWGWLAAGWLLFGSVPGRAALLLLARKLFLRDLRPGRYPRHSSLNFRIWLVERMAAAWRLEGLAGTPWADRYARMCGHSVGKGARLATLPPIASLVTVGENATLEGEVDIEGWWMEGGELVVGELKIGARARVGTMSVLMPGSEVGEGAELEPGTVVSGVVPAGERWAGSPGRRVGVAGEDWPAEPAPAPRRERFWKGMYALGMTTKLVVPLVAALPEVLLVSALAPAGSGAMDYVVQALMLAPLLVLCYILVYGLLVAALIRAVSPLLRPGVHPDFGSVGFALWLTDSLMTGANNVLFALYASVYTRAWLRLLGIRTGRRAEVSVASGLNCLTSFGEKSFCADAVAFVAARARQGWLHLAPIEVGARSFLGNGAIVLDSTRLGAGSMIGVLTRAPLRTAEDTSWLGCPALELPRRPEAADPARTTEPPKRLVVARGAMEIVRMLLGDTLTLAIAVLVFGQLDQIGAHDGTWTMAALTPVAFLAGGIIATVMTIVLKWLMMGRYRPGSHPLWSFFVWRDEIMNTTQERLAGAWLMGAAQATPLMSLYLRLMGAKVGRDVWCETGTITEFDMVELGDGCAINRAAIVQTHLFHDRVLQIGPTKLGAGSTLGPIAAILPDTELGAGCTVGALSIVMRGETLPAGTRWHGAPVIAAG